MQITLNKESWHFKYYSWVRNNENPPKSLCPYFWSMVVFIVFSPFIIVGKCLTIFLTKVIEKRLDKVSHRTPEERTKAIKWENRIEKTLETTGKIILSLSVLFIVVLFCLLFYHTVQEVGIFGLLNGIFVIIGVLTVIYFIVDKWVEKRFGRKIIRSKVIQIPVEMVKSIYNKACPMINWTSTKTVVVTNEKVS